MKTIQNQTFDQERALYGSSGILVKHCSFDGPADGESTAFLTCATRSGTTTAFPFGIRK